MVEVESSLLQVRGLSKIFGGVRALDGFDMDLQSGELVGLIGPNGSGKTTAFNLLTGVLKPTAGRIMFRGQDVSVYDSRGLVADAITRAGSSDPKAGTEALASTSDYADAVTGAIAYVGGSRVPSKPVAIMQVVDGAVSLLTTVTPKP
jgi:ABC-type cobalamin/Fe3+-siderophores transport system ATPase subunit